MPDKLTSIFISYAHADSPFVDRLEADLCQHGFAPWVDRHGLAGGQKWRRELEAAVDRSQVLLVVLSPEAMASEYVQQEYGYASDEGKVVIPVLATWYICLEQVTVKTREHAITDCKKTRSSGKM